MDGSIPSVAQTNNPSGVVVYEEEGQQYITLAERSGHVLRRVNADSVLGTIAGLAGVPGSTDSSPLSARFDAPEAVVQSASGEGFFVADSVASTHVVGIHFT